MVVVDKDLLVFLGTDKDFGFLSGVLEDLHDLHDQARIPHGQVPVAQEEEYTVDVLYVLENIVRRTDQSIVEDTHTPLILWPLDLL